MEHRGPDFIPIYQPTISGNEKKYVIDCLDTNWISSKGGYVEKFEKAFAKRIGVKYSTSCSSGTTALHLAFLSVGIRHGDEVLVPTFTYVASVNAVSYVGAKPIFVDSCQSTWQIDCSLLESKITERTKAIVAVHVYGGTCDMEAIMKIAEKYKLYVIEDCAEAFGSYYGDKHVGAIGHISVFSFYGNKTITTGEGGMLATNDPTLLDRAVHFKGQGLAPYRQYWHDIVGYNYRMTNICAAIGLAQLEQADCFIARKKEIASLYVSMLAALPVVLQGNEPGSINSYWMVSILLGESETRDALRNYLSEREIETRPTFYPVHTMPMYSQEFQSFPVAESIGWRGINLPSWPGLSDEKVARISSSIREFFKGRR